MPDSEQPPAAELVAEVERRLEQIEQLRDPVAREPATAVVGALLDLYGAGLERIVEAVAARDDGELAAALAADELVAHLLLLHGLHPVPLEARVGEALEEVRPYLDSHGGDVELLDVQASSVRLRLRGSCSGCPSSTITLKLAIENAIRKAAPEIEEVIAVHGTPTPQGPPLLSIEVLGGVGAEQPSSSRGENAPSAKVGAVWTMAGGLPDLHEGQAVVRTIAGQPILFLDLGRGPLAYRPGCPACGSGLTSAALLGSELACPGCANRYDPLRGGRCLDSPELALEPVPLLKGEDGLVRVALPVPA